MNREDIYVGQVLWMNHKRSGTGGIRELVKVTRINPKNVKAESENGTVWTVHPSFLSHADAGDVCSFEIKAPGHQLTLGAVVQFREGSSYHGTYGHLYSNLVVIASKKDGYWAVAPLGGDQGKYFSRVSADSLVVQPVTIVE